MSEFLYLWVIVNNCNRIPDEIQKKITSSNRAAYFLHMKFLPHCWYQGIQNLNCKKLIGFVYAAETWTVLSVSQCKAF